MNDIKNIINFDNKSGLSISSRGEILEDLINLTRIAYGQDYVIEQGNEWYSFLDLLAGELAELGGAVQDVYNSLSFITASGTNLDNVVSFVGITRKAKKNSTLLVKATVDTSDGIVSLPYNIPAGNVTLKDINGGKWKNKTNLLIEKYKPDGTTPNSVGTALFEASEQNTDPTNLTLLPYNAGNPAVPLEVISGSVPMQITFMNEIASELGNEEETDAQLRVRYKENLYKSSAGTVDGLISAIKDNSNATYVHIIENDTDKTDVVNNLPPHSIWVIVDGNSQFTESSGYSTYPDDIAIGNAILKYKSLGCGTSYGNDTYTPYNTETMLGGTGAISVQITEDSTEYVINFSRANNIPCFVTVELSSNIDDNNKKYSIEYAIRQNIISYVNNLGISNDVLQSGLSCAVYNVIETNDYVDYVFDINSITAGRSEITTDKRIVINENEYPSITEENIKINWS